MSQPSASGSNGSRPQTHKPRGICRYYQEPRGCFAGDKCKFLHGQPSLVENTGQDGAAATPASTSVLLTPYDQAKVCRHYSNGYCKRGETCWFRHVSPSSNGKGREAVADGSDSDSTPVCSICFEQPDTYGLLEKCNHIFCISCIKQWRDVKTKSIDVISSGNKKKCPMCRTSTNFITPSSNFFQHGSAEKKAIIARYQESMSKVQCRYFQKSRNKDPMCPFGKDCFYRHEKADGTLHVFTEGASYWMKRYEARRRGNRIDPVFSISDPESITGRLFRLPFTLQDPLFLNMFRQREAQAAGNGPGTGNSQTTGNANGPAQTNPNVSVSLGLGGELRARQRGDGTIEWQLADSRPDNMPIRDAASHARRFRTVRDIGQSLHDLTRAMDDGATLERISERVQTLQNRLRRETIAEAVGNDESMERLQSLADQMLASIELLQTADVRSVNPIVHASAPATNGNARDPLHPDPNMPPFLDERERTNQIPPVTNDAPDDDDDDNDSMPDLQSISNSSEDEDLSDYETTDSEFDAISDGEDDQNRFIRAARLAGFEPLQNPTNGTTNTEDSGSASSSTPNAAAASGSAATNSTMAPEDEEGNQSDDAPELLDLNEEEEDRALRRMFSLEPLPPFVTDGRGRAVWTSQSAEPNIGTSPSSPQSAPSGPTAPFGGTLSVEGGPSSPSA